MTTKPEHELSINQDAVSDNIAMPLDDVGGTAAGPVPETIALQQARLNNQWHLNNTSNDPRDLDLNLGDVWLDYTGDGVTVAVYDNGVEATHPSLSANYRADLEVDNGNNAAPEANDFHGTAVAGIIAGENSFEWGPVGIAYDASIVGVDIWNQQMGPAADPEGPVIRDETNVSQTTAFRENFDIVNQSFRFVPFERGYPADAVYENIELATQQGRGGLGTIVVQAAGNDRASNWDTNAQLLQNDRHSVVVAGVDERGDVSSGSNPGANVLTSAFYWDVGTTDRVGAAGYNSAGDTHRFPGTSAAAPQVSGVVALMLEANPDLGWRDVQTILSYTSRHVGDDMDVQPTYNPMAATPEFAKYAWHYNDADNWNNGGLHFSNDYGFGLVDAHAAVRLAESWTEQSTSTNEEMIGGRGFAEDFNGADDIPEGGGVLRRAIIVPQDQNVETIELELDISHARMSDLIIRLVSPEGTVSTLLNRPGLGQGDEAINRTWTLTSNEFRGEKSAGQWFLEVEDVTNGALPGDGSDNGTIGLATLRTYGSGTGEMANDTYIYTDEFSAALSDGAAQGDLSRAHLADTDGGLDTINAAAVSSSVRLDLNEGHLNFIGENRFQIDAGTEIEWAFGGDGNDEIVGNALSNLLRGNRGDDFLAGKDDFDILEGGAGDDVLAGGAAADQLIGGEGNDFASYYDATAGVSVSLADDSVATGDAIGDMFQSIEGLIGSAHADRLFGDANDNELRGGEGNDELDGGAGADTMRGGNGDDGYTVDNAGDIIEELAGEGTKDTVYAKTADYQLGANVENVYYLGSLDQAFHGTGNDEANLIVSMGGNDILDGGANDDVLIGFNPIMTGVNSGRDTLIGGAGNDHMTGGDNVDTYVFGDGWGNDIIGDFAVGEDVLDMRQVSGLNRSLLTIANDENGNAKVSYGSNSITLIGVTADEARNANFLFNTSHIVGTEGDDVLVADAFANIMEGHGGHDRFHAAYSSNPADIDVMDGGAGIDTLDLSSLDTAMWVGLDYAGREVWTQDTDNVDGINWREVADLVSIENVVGTKGSDYIAGDAGNNILSGGAGNDKIYTHDGSDKVYGDAGDDWIVSGAGWSELYGGDGNDTVIGGSTYDMMDGGAGNDTFIGTGGQTTMFGGDGDDTFIGSKTSTNAMYGGAGNDTYTGGDSTDWVYDVDGGNDIAHGGGGYDVFVDWYGVNELYGEGGDDWIISCSNQGSLLDGGDGNDTLNAYYGGNTLIGGAGNDLLENGEGGALASTFTGGAGADTFIYRPGVSIEANVVVTDFEDGLDHIGLYSWLSYWMTYEQLTITDTDEGAIISFYDASPMLLKGISADHITRDDFLLV